MATASAVNGTLSFPKNVRPPIVTFAPSMWSDIFSSFSLNEQVQEKYAKEIEQLKEEARSILTAKGSAPAEKVILIDTLERLGVAYHFKQEIEEQLQRIFDSHFNPVDYDLFTTALQFRLLRQHRYHVPCGVFDKFVDKTNNKFHAELSTDVVGLLSLYQAANVRIHGEDILEQAIAFTTHHLTSMLPLLNSPLRDEVERALHQSLHRGIPRIETRNHISFYEKYERKNEMLLKFAKLDFNYLQNLYKKELCELSRWWYSFDLPSKLPYARDRWVECYLWGQTLHFEPQYSYVRIAVAKGMQMVSVLDDTYDNYATIEEAELFTKAIEKWDISEVDRLPELMQVVYRYVLSIYDENEKDAVKQGKSYIADYAKETVKDVARAYNRELKWFLGREMATFEEYFANTVYTSCIYLMMAVMLPGMPSASKDMVDWIASQPQLIIATAKMGRYVEDLGSQERENRGGEMPTAVDIYMKQHGLSKQETLDKFIQLADEGWKDLNTEWVKKTSVPDDIIQQLLNYARAAEVTYKNCADGYTYPEKYLGPQIAALLVDPIII